MTFLVSSEVEAVEWFAEAVLVPENQKHSDNTQPPVTMKPTNELSNEPTHKRTNEHERTNLNKFKEILPNEQLAAEDWPSKKLNYRQSSEPGR